MKHTTTPHWLTPTSMIGALAAGVLFAGGHHLFYSSLDGTPVEEGSFFGSSVSKQQFNVSVGLAFAFLVKACLVFSMSVAFVQLFWREAKVPHPGHVPTLARLDTLHSVFNNVWALVDVRVWLRCPLPFLIAALAWIIPIASIISPATLSIRMAAATPVPESLQRVPNLDFGSMNFLAPLPHMPTNDPLGLSSDQGSYLYNGPSQAVLEVSNAVMAQGEFLPIQPPAPNSSWTVEYVGPSIQCNNVADEMHQRIRQNIAAGMNKSDGADLYGYLGWFPMFGWVDDEMTGASNPMPFLSPAANGSLQFNAGQSAGISSVDNITFYMASLPTIFGATGQMTIDAFSNPKDSVGIPAWIDGRIVQCVLFNSTYQAFFDYQDGSQKIEYNVTTFEKIVPQQSLLGPNPDNPAKDPCKNPDALSADLRDQCYNNREMLQSLSSIGLLDAMGNILRGSVSVDGLQQMNRSSNVLSTSLLNIEDLSFLKKAAAVQLGNNTLQAQLLTSTEQKSLGLVNNDDIVLATPLHKAMEEMFQKMTISLMSSSALQPNYSSISAPSPVKVTLPAYSNIYTYSAFKLWAAYGSAIFLALLTMFLGLVTIFLNGASYSGNFSAIFLAAKGALLSEKIREDDLDGQDPLPKYLAGAQVSFGTLDHDQKDRRLFDGGNARP